MSIDYIALPQRDRSLLNSPEKGPRIDKEGLATAIMGAEPNFSSFQKDYQAIADFENCTVEEAKKRWNHIELNWMNDQDNGSVQILIYDNYIRFETAGGESGLKPIKLALKICELHNLHIFDPQNDAWLQSKPT